MLPKYAYTSLSWKVFDQPCSLSSNLLQPSYYYTSPLPIILRKIANFKVNYFIPKICCIFGKYIYNTYTIYPKCIVALVNKYIYIVPRVDKTYTIYLKYVVSLVNTYIVYVIYTYQNKNMQNGAGTLARKMFNICKVKLATSCVWILWMTMSICLVCQRKTDLYSVVMARDVSHAALLKLCWLRWIILKVATGRKRHMNQTASPNCFRISKLLMGEIVEYHLLK